MVVVSQVTGTSKRPAGCWTGPPQRPQTACPSSRRRRWESAGPADRAFARRGARQWLRRHRNTGWQRLRENLRGGRRQRGWTPRGQRQGARSIGRADLGGRIQRFEVQHLRVLLRPFQGAQRAADADAQGVFHAGRRLRDPEAAARATAQAQQGARVVVGLAAGHDGADVGRHLVHLQPGDEAQQLVGVGADVAHHQRCAAARRVGFPGGAARPGLGAAALHVFHLHQADVAQLAVGHHGARLAHQRVAAVVVGQAKHPAGVLHALAQLLGLGQGVGHGLVADDVKALGQRRHGIGEVAVVGRHDGHHVGTVGRGLLAVEQACRWGNSGRAADPGTGPASTAFSGSEDSAAATSS